MALEHHYAASRRKIDPQRRWHKSGPFSANPPALATLREWQDKGLSPPDLADLRHYRLARVKAQLRTSDYAGILLADLLNVRYATDSINMQLWCAHNAVRYVFIATDGPVIVFEFHGSEHLSNGLELVSEVRPAIAWNYMAAGDHFQARAQKWADEIADVVVTYGGGNKRLAVDRLNPEGAEALQQGGITLHNGEQVMELARVIKAPVEITAMRCAIVSCEAAIDEMRAAMVPGVTENELWSHLHAGNIKRGGEWIETRLLSSGPRTNPWMQECSSRIIEAGDIVAFDTDMIGPYGYCVDISRAWLCGDVRASDEQRWLHDIARRHIEENMALLEPGISFRELTEKSHRLPEDCRKNRYSLIMHGVGLCDEYPAVRYPEDTSHETYDGVVEAGMVLCVEAYVGRETGAEGIKLEQQVLVTETGHQLLSHYPWDDALTV
jgi:Xaa-Pro aminopeptidase